MKPTIIYSGGDDTTARDLMVNTPGDMDFWFPELQNVENVVVPLNHKQQRFLLPKLIETTFVTMSEIIILTFLREVRKGRMDAKDLELYCDNRRIEVAMNGDMIDYWDGHFFETGFNLRFH